MDTVVEYRGLIEAPYEYRTGLEIAACLKQVTCDQASYHLKVAFPVARLNTKLIIVWKGHS